MKPIIWKDVIANVQSCPDGNTIACCADCLSDLIEKLLKDLEDK